MVGRLGQGQENPPGQRNLKNIDTVRGNAFKKYALRERRGGSNVRLERLRGKKATTFTKTAGGNAKFRNCKKTELKGGECKKIGGQKSACWMNRG